MWVDIERTVDGNGNGFAEDIAVIVGKSWDLAELVQLEIVGWGFSAGLGLYDLEIKLVCLGHKLDGFAAGVVLVFESEGQKAGRDAEHTPLV